MLNEHKRKCSRTRESSGLISRNFTTSATIVNPQKRNLSNAK